MKKILIIRLSSFGDIVQALPAAQALKNHFEDSEIHWLVRDDYRELIASHKHVDHLWSFPREKGLSGLFTLFSELKKQNYDYIYDAHNNLRSNILINLFRLTHLWKNKPRIIQRPKSRFKRFLFFKLRRPVFPQPFIGSLSFIEPLNKIGIPTQMPPAPNLYIQGRLDFTLPERFIALVPSAAWPNKRWPLDHWKDLILNYHEHPYVVLGGPQDHFCQELADLAPERVINLAGKTSLMESCLVIQESMLTISADTGLLHVADQSGVLNLGLIGPTAFGYTAQPQSKILEVELYCKPCSKDGRDPCINKVYQKCMKEITPKMVEDTARRMLGVQ